MKRVKKLAFALSALPVLAGPVVLTPTPTADAATATLAGMFGLAPQFSSITDDGRPLCPCRPVEYSTLPGLISTAEGVQALDQWISTTLGSKTVVAYSKGTHSALGWLRENAGDSSAHGIQFVLLAAPETPGNGKPAIGHEFQTGLPSTGDFQNVTFVVRQYDSVADAPTNVFNFLARVNASFSTHLAGYDDLDLANPDAVFVDPKTGAKTLYFRTDVLPILAWTQWFASEEQIAEWDALLRPLIEAGYDRPVDIPNRTAALSTVSSTVTAAVEEASEAPVADQSRDRSDDVPAEEPDADAPEEPAPSVPLSDAVDESESLELDSSEVTSGSVDVVDVVDVVEAVDDIEPVVDEPTELSEPAESAEPADVREETSDAAETDTADTAPGPDTDDAASDADGSGDDSDAATRAA